MNTLNGLPTSINQKGPRYIQTIKKYKGRIVLGVIAGLMLQGSVLSYRGFYTWSDRLFQAKTLSLVNDILEESGKVKELPKNSQCDYSESHGGDINITCNNISVNIRISPNNSDLYRCQDIKTDRNGYLDIETGYCIRGKYDEYGAIKYYDKNGNEISLDFIPGKLYPMPITAHQG